MFTKSLTSKLAFKQNVDDILSFHCINISKERKNIFEQIIAIHQLLAGIVLRSYFHFQIKLYLSL